MTTITINKGSDLDLNVTWGDEGNLDGATVSLYDVHPSLVNHLTASILDSAARTIACRLEWDESIQSGAYFRLKVSTGSDDKTSERFKITVQ